MMDTPSDFDWENLPEFANFDMVTVGSLVNLHRLDQHDIIRLVENLAPGHSATGIDYKANQLTKDYCAVKKRCVQGTFCKVVAVSWLASPYKTKKPKGTSKNKKCTCCHPTPLTLVSHPPPPLQPSSTPVPSVTRLAPVYYDGYETLRVLHGPRYDPHPSKIDGFRFVLRWLRGAVCITIVT